MAKTQIRQSVKTQLRSYRTQETGKICNEVKDVVMWVKTNKYTGNEQLIRTLDTMTSAGRKACCPVLF